MSPTSYQTAPPRGGPRTLPARFGRPVVDPSAARTSDRHRALGDERDVREAVHVAHVHPLDPGLVDLVVGEAGRELLERDPGLEPGQGGAEAEVQTVPEAHREVPRAPDVEAVGVVVRAL